MNDAAVTLFILIVTHTRVSGRITENDRVGRHITYHGGTNSDETPRSNLRFFYCAGIGSEPGVVADTHLRANLAMGGEYAVVLDDAIMTEVHMIVGLDAIAQHSRADSCLAHAIERADLDAVANHKAADVRNAHGMALLVIDDAESFLAYHRVRLDQTVGADDDIVADHDVMPNFGSLADNHVVSDDGIMTDADVRSDPDITTDDSGRGDRDRPARGEEGCDGARERQAWPVDEDVRHRQPAVRYVRGGNDEELPNRVESHSALGRADICEYKTAWFGLCEWAYLVDRDIAAMQFGPQQARNLGC